MYKSNSHFFDSETASLSRHSSATAFNAMSSFNTNNKDYPFSYNSNSHSKVSYSGLELGLKYLVSESYKFIGMADDLHDVASYLSEMRICFIMLTITAYFLLAVFLIRMCIRRSQHQVNSRNGGGGGSGGCGGGAGSTTGSNGQRRYYSHNSRASPWEYQTNDEYQNAIPTANHTTTADDLVSVRSDGQIGAVGLNSGLTAAAASKTSSYLMGRNHRTQAPSFMRHSHHMNHQSTTGGSSTIDNSRDCNSVMNSSSRLLSNTDNNEITSKHNGNSSNVSGVDSNSHYHHHHQIPHIVTTPETGYATGSGENDLNPQQSTKMVNLRHHNNATTSGRALTTISKITAATNM